MSSRVKNRREQLLGGVGMAIIASSPALAGTATVTQNVTNAQGDVASVANAFETIYSNPINSAQVAATITNASAGISRTDSWNGSLLSSTDTLTANLVSAQALGNTFTNTAPLAVLDSEEGSDGLTSLGVAVNSGYVTSLVGNTMLQVSLVNTPLDSATNSGNTVSAATTINAGTTTLSGSVPSTYTSGTVGHAAIDALATTDLESTATANVLDASGSVLASTVQYAVGTTPSTALTSDTTVSLDLQADTGLLGGGFATTSGAGALSDNTVKSSYAGNAAATTIGLAGGANPTFAGSAVLNTTQINGGNVGGDQAVTVNTNIRASVDSVEGDVNSLTGSLTVDGNTVSASATGNESLGNSLTASGLNLAGTASAAGATVDDRLFSANTVADGALVISGVQYNDGYAQDEGAVLSASTTNAGVTGYAQELSGGTVDVSGNTVSAAVRGNNWSDTLGTDGTVNSLTGAVTAATYQLNDGTTIAGTVQFSGVIAAAGDGEVGDVDNASLTAAHNVVSATAYGNQVSHALSLDATALNAGAFSGTVLTADSEGLTTASGLATLTNVQANYGSAVSATNAVSLIGAFSDSEFSTSGTTLKATANRQEAVAAGNLATSAVSLNATSVGGGAGLVNAQSVAEGSPVTSSLSASAIVATDGTLGIGSTASLADNLQRSIAYGSSANNSLTAAATQTATSFIPGPSSILSGGDFEAFSQVNATYGLLNSQATLSDVTALAASTTDGNFVADAFNDVEASSLTNSRNTLVVGAYGTSAANTATVGLGNVDTIEGSSTLANLSNSQYVGFGAAVAAEATNNQRATVLTNVSDDVWDSTVATDGNTVQAQAVGNSADNTLKATGTTVFVPGIGAFATANIGAFEDAALGVNNVQVAEEGTSFTATLRNGVDGFRSASVLTDVGGMAAGSTVQSLDNSLLASAGANSASNVLAANINELAGSAAVNNAQVSFGDVSATMGVAGTPAVAGVSSTYEGSGSSVAGNSAGIASNYDFVTQQLVVADGEQVTLAQGAMSSTEWNALVTYMTARGWVLSAPNALSTNGNGSYDVSFFDNFGFTNGNGVGAGTATYTGFSVAGTPAVPNQGGVTIAIGSDIEASTVSVAGNVAAARGVANEATNSLTLSANAVGQVFGGLGATTGGSTTTADYVVNNAQGALGNVTTDNIGTFAIEQDPTASIDGSTLSVADNAQSAKSLGNLASNSLTIAATDLGTDPISAGLGSTQFAEQASVASSQAQFSVPAESADSTIAITGNSNSALAVQNDVKNTLSVTGTNVGSSFGLPATGSTGLANADIVLGSAQSASGLASATATSSISNQDLVDLSTAGVLNGSVAFTGNLTSAEAAANRSANAGTVTGTSGQGASVSLVNTQGSSSSVNASATSTTTLQLTGYTDAESAVLDLSPFQSSSAQVAGNTTQALARGNSATNTLASTAGAGYGTASVLLPGAGNGVATADAVILNAQTNSGPVAAQATNVVYSVVLNSGAGAPSVGASSVGVSGNTAAAAAYGNQAVNSLTLSALNTGLATGAVYNTQNNSGAVTAVATSVSYGVNAAAGVTNASTFGVSGNAVTAAAVGNSAVSSIIGR